MAVFLVLRRCFVCYLILRCFGRVLAPFLFDLNYPLPVADDISVEEQQVAAHHEVLAGPSSFFLTPSVTQHSNIGSNRRKCRDEEPSNSSASSSLTPVENVETLADPKHKKARVDLIRPEISYLDDFHYISGAKSSVAVVREWQSIFEERLGSKQFDSTSAGRAKAVIHPNLRFAMMRSKNRTPPGLVVLKVLLKTSDHVQSYEKWRKLFKMLITYVYELHQVVLIKSGMTAPAHRLQHHRLFDWLVKEIYQPGYGNLPVIGIIQAPYPDWKGDRPLEGFGRTQIELIDYFSGDGEHEAAAKKAVYLVATYQEQNPGKCISVDSAHSIHDDAYHYNVP
ncbi:hypothetical protein PTTG_12034 [Puccinia triticina 1-1 BBBD Race 1]|uniref:Uncharacterized protein n=2 Tax=Puccinia triticina TaxID=208348 RepID=A0A180GNI4_PUCT1|nr:uncharacterized protein PtA15_13A187 [Puccinia triticina]OAV94367.1 hypothetical protein PTTG_12034 [Puccinia triticina 1-1 BBBD Race 1]WAQ90788.1 hypothetical protein PtA15_13A187 [Puccinia triticina]WAR60974.1 hypothetical protein PtB15_13B225 [Puccinia triticina]